MRSLRIVFAVAAVAAGAAETTAQRASSWVPAPAPAVSPSSVDDRGKLVWFEDAGQVFVFSASTRSWATRAKPASASIRFTNDWLLIEDSTAGSFAAFSSARGRFETLQTSPLAAVVNPSTGRNDGILLVIDGQTLWSFTGFGGHWNARALPTNALISVQRNVAIVADGTDLWAMSAVSGDWVHTTTAAPIQAIGTGDTAAWASDGTDGYGFSAIRNVWAAAALPAGSPASPLSTRDVVIWGGTFQVLGFSGVRGTFDLATTGQPTTLDVGDHLATASAADNRQHWLFSVPNAQWTSFVSPQPATARVDAAVVLLIEPGRVHAYSALTSTIATLTMANPVTSVNAAVATALDLASGDLELFSAMTGTWTPAPPAARVALPQLARNGALLRDSSGATAWAYSARSGRFFPRALGGTPALHVDLGSSVLAAEDDTALAVFDPHREVWLETPILAADRPLNVRIWRTTLVAFSPTEGIGYSPMHGTIERMTLPGALLDPRAGSENGAAITAAGVVAYSSVPDLRTEAQFPEFRRMFGRGSRIDLEFTGAPGAVAGAVSGFAHGSPTTIPGLGELVLDPGALVPITMTALDQEGLSAVHLPIPDVPALAGLELAFQAVVVPIGPASAYLTRACSFRIH